MNFLKFIIPFLFLPALTSAQITITSELNPIPGESIDYRYVHSDTLSPGPSGDNQFWPFTVKDSALNAFNYLLPSSTPFDDSIADPTKNLSIKVKSGYTYYATNSSAWDIVGYASDNFVVEYSNHLPLFEYPMLFDSSNTVTYSDSATAIFNNTGVETHRSAKISAVVDADGFLNVSDTFQNTLVSGGCIRVHVTEFYHDDTYVNGIFFKAYETTVESFYWISEDPTEIVFLYQTIDFVDLAVASNSTSRKLARYLNP